VERGQPAIDAHGCHLRRQRVLGHRHLGRELVRRLVLHWNGVRWTVPLRLKQSGYHADFTGVTALSPSNVWVFGGEQNGLTDLVGFGTWHFNGRT